MNWLETLGALSAITALSGHEEPMIAYMKEHFAPFADDMEVDPLGNVICRIRGRGRSGDAGDRSGSVGGGPAMVFAHMDELGLIVRKVEPTGYLRVVRVGGVPERVLQGQRVVLTGDAGLVYGVIGVKSHHVTTADEKYKVVPVDDCYIDIGARDADEVEALGVHVGTPITYDIALRTMPGGLVTGKALDDRLGCAILLALAERLHADRPALDVALVATVQEEFNIRGVLPAAYALEPVLGICVDVAVAHDTPDLAARADVALGAGPVVGYYSFHGRGTLGGLIPNPKLRQGIEDTAHRLGMPVQRNVFFGGLGDSSFMQLVRRGIPAVDVGFPCRYTHTPVETAAIADAEAAATLVAEYLLGLEQVPDFSRG